jgi:malonate-semialdehyde dehydrogenase (acetylating)/methylmalonate-semialdehyde dehydrogenase
MSNSKNPSDLPVLLPWINGSYTDAAGTRSGDVFNPALGRVIRRVRFCGSADVDKAVKAARAAFPGWRDTTPMRRARVLMRIRELMESNRKELVNLIIEEHGKAMLDADGSVQRGIEMIEFASGVPHLMKGEFAEDVGRGIDCHSIMQPIGVCAGIVPFNFPVMVPLWMIPVAIACGNAFVLKPSEKVPSAALRMAELFKEAGLPDGVFNVVPGDKEAVDALLAHPEVNTVSSVGSSPVAKYIYETASSHGKRVQALGGAKNHAIVMPDCDLAFSADAIISAGYGSTGERCMAISTVVVVGGIADALVDRLREQSATIKVGPGGQPGIDMGPIVTAAQRDKVKGYIDLGVKEGAKLVVDGRGLKVAGFENGFFLGPTLFDRVTTDMTIYKDEIFGPVLIVLRVESLDEAIALVNRNPYGNGVAIFTSSGAAARQFERDIDVAMVGVNVPIPVPMAFFSFGGWKKSFFGDRHVYGMEGVQFYTRSKVVTSRWPESDEKHPTTLAMPTM